MKILVTGVAGFIGMHVARRLLDRGDSVFGLDSINDYYDTNLKRDRLAQLESNKNFEFNQLNIADQNKIEILFKNEKFDKVIHLAAQAGVRYSINNPHSYVESNLVGFINILEGCRRNMVDHLVYASSSSVYGGNTKTQFSESDSVDTPVSLYAATKKANELMAHSYSHLYGLATTGLRFFTVYGPWGRPDMSPWLFTSAILEGRPIDVYNNGMMERDFTYVDDIVEGTLRALDREKNALLNTTGEYKVNDKYKIYNIGNNKPIQLMTFISTIEEVLGKQAEKNFLPMQPGDMISTSADISQLKKDVGYLPCTELTEGIKKWIFWYKSYKK